MKSIHEQDWHRGRNTWHIRDADGNIKALVTTDDQSAAEADAVAQAVTALPDMARALLPVAQEGCFWGAGCGEVRPPCPSCAATAALKKAGVLP